MKAQSEVSALRSAEKSVVQPVLPRSITSSIRMARRKTWPEGVAERRGRKAWPKGVAGRRGRKAWPKGVVGRRACRNRRRGFGADPQPCELGEGQGLHQHCDLQHRSLRSTCLTHAPSQPMVQLSSVEVEAQPFGRAVQHGSPHTILRRSRAQRWCRIGAKNLDLQFANSSLGPD